MFRDDSVLPFHVQPGVTVRVADEADAHEAIRVGSRAFNQNTEHVYNAGTAIVAAGEDGRIGAALEAVIQPMWWGTAQVPGASVSWVATDPSAQGKGLGGALMSGAVRHFYEIGAAASALWPFSFAYYRKTGWELTAYDLEIRLWPAMADRLAEVPGTVRAIAPDDRAALAGVYDRHVRSFNGYGVRDAAVWEDLHRRRRILEDTLVYEDSAGAVQGYAHFQRMKQPYSDRHVVHIRELCFAEHGAAIALLRAAAHRPNAAEALVRVPKDSLLVELLPDRVKIDAVQRCQLRVVNVSRALEALTVPEELRGTISFEIFDNVVSPGAPIAITATVEGGRIAVSPGATGNAYRCSIAAFSKLYGGGVTPEVLRAVQRLEGGTAEGDALWNSLHDGRKPFRGDNEAG